MEFNYNDSDKKKKIITIAAIMIIACIIIAVVIFIMTNEDLFTNNPSNSSTPSEQQTGIESPTINSSDPTASNNARQPKEIKIRYENDMLIFEGLSKECEFNTVFENSKDYILMNTDIQMIQRKHHGTILTISQLCIFLSCLMNIILINIRKMRFFQIMQSSRKLRSLRI